MDYYFLFLRIVHILGGVFWVGGSLMMTFFIGPTAGATAEAGQKFVAHLMNNLKFSQRMSAAAGLTVLAGVLLYLRDAGSSSHWVSTSAGRGFGIGAVFGLIGFVYGIMVGRTMKAMAQLGAQFQGKPSDEQMAQMQALRKKQATYSNISVATLIIAVILMSISHYLIF